MSIFGTFFTIEDERQWVSDLEASGIKAGVIREGEPGFDDIDAPLIYQGSHVLPEHDHPRGGSVDLGYINAFIRHGREHPDDDHEPYLPVEPFLRLGVTAHKDTYHGGRDATVLLTLHQATRLRDALTEWIELTQTTDAEYEARTEVTDG